MVNAEETDERVTELLKYSERDEFEVTTPVTVDALPEPFLVLLNGERCLAAIDVETLHDYPIDGRFHNETDEARTFTVTVTDADGTVLVEDEQTVGPTDSYPIPAVGRPGATQTFDVTVGNASVTETFTFDVERTPEKVDGYVDVTFTPIEYPHDAVVTPDRRVDTPPYEIERPEQPDDPSGGDWNEEYLGDNMKRSPSVEFTTVTRRRGVLPLRQYDFDGGDFYWAELVTSERTRDVLLDLDGVEKRTRTRLSEVDFDESVLVAVETGSGSGSVEHRWARIESTENGVHLHEYYTNPYIQTDDLTTRVSLLEVARPADEVDVVRVSLTVDENRRVHFNSTEGTVTMDSS